MALHLRTRRLNELLGRSATQAGQVRRPLYVAEVGYKVSKFSLSRSCLLVVTGTELVVLNVSSKDKLGAVSDAAEVMVLVQAAQLLPPISSHPNTLRVEYLEQTTTVPVSLFGLGSTPCPAPDTSFHTTSTGSSSSSSIHPSLSAVSSGSGLSEPSGADATASPHVTGAKDYFLVTFSDEEAAAAAAGAIVYAIATTKATAGYLYKGLPPAFALGLAGVALDYRSSGSFASSSKLHQPAVVPIHGPSPWAVAVPLPSSWQPVLNKDMQQLLQFAPLGDAFGPGATASRILTRSMSSIRRTHSLLRNGSTADMNQCVLRKALLQPKTLPKGSPEAVAVHLSTPMGVAVARITPQHVEMAVAMPDCDVVLAVPAVTGAGDSGVTEELEGGTSETLLERLQLGFTYEVVGAVGSVTGSSSSMEAASAAAAAVGSSVGIPSVKTVRHGQVVYSGIKITVKRKADLLPDIQLLTCPALSAPATSNGDTNITSTSVTSARGDTNSMVHALQQLHPWLAVAAAAFLLPQLWLQPLAVLFALLPAALLLLALQPQLLLLLRQGGAVHGSSSTSQPAAAVAKQGAVAPARAAAATAVGVGEELHSEEEWVVVLEGALLENQPGSYLQLQISLAKAQAAAAAAAAAAGGPGAVLTAGPPVKPYLISEPEPKWVTPDVYQRFMQAKPTLAGCRQQAAQTDAWRRRVGADQLLRKPCRSFDFMREYMQDYILQAEPGCDVVELVKIADMKRLAEALKGLASGFTHGDYEEYLAFRNEYMYTVAAPDPLPLGMFQLILDCKGVAFNMIMGDTIALFKVVASMGQYYPERLSRALIVNAPSWFEFAWKIAGPMLDEATRSKVVVAANPQHALRDLQDALGPHMVPLEYGGPCTLRYDEYPADKAFVAFHQKLKQAAAQQQLRLQRVPRAARADSVSRLPNRC